LVVETVGVAWQPLLAAGRTEDPEVGTEAPLEAASEARTPEGFVLNVTNQLGVEARLAWGFLSVLLVGACQANQ